MRSPSRQRKCLHCKELFLPNPRAAERQRYCLKAECRKARKHAVQRAWLAKPENRNYFRDTANAERVRNWQKVHPGYWKNTMRYRRRTLQDGCKSQVSAGQTVTAQPTVTPPPSPAPLPPPTTIAATPAPSPPEPLLAGAVAASAITVLPAAASSPSRTFRLPELDPAWVMILGK